MGLHRISRALCVSLLLPAALAFYVACGASPAAGVVICSSPPALPVTGTESWGEARWPAGMTACYAVEQTADDIILAGFGGPTHSGIYRSYDEGVTWEAVAVAAVGTYYVNDISFADARNGLAVGLHQDGPTTQSLILETTDGGRAWTRVDGASGTGEPALRAVDYDKPLSAIAVTTAGVVYTLENNNTWTQRSISGSPELRDVAVMGQGDDLAAAIVGDGGVLWQVTRTPTAWTFVQKTNTGTLADEDLRGVADRSSGFTAIGLGEFQLDSNNYGANWARGTAIAPPLLFDHQYYAIDFGGGAGVAVGESELLSNGSLGKAVRWTTDGGLTWSGQTLPVGGSSVLTGASMYSNGESSVHSNDRVYHRSKPSLVRWGGADRYETAYSINKYSFEAPYGQWAVIATGKDFPDALCAAGLAGAVNAPVLIVKDSLSALQLLQLDLLDITAAYIVGGSGAVPASVENQLTGAGIQWQRIAGADRYATSARVADQIKYWHDQRMELTDYCFVARGDAFPDALALSPLAYSQEYPILLTKPTSLPAVISECIDENGYEYGWLAGGTAAVSDSVKSIIDGKLINNGGSWLVRMAGASRYETSAKIAEEGIDATWATGGYFGIATGRDFPDALVGGAVAGAKSGVLLLTEPTALPSVAEDVISTYRRYDTDIRVYGGTGVVSDTVYGELGSLLP